MATQDTTENPPWWGILVGPLSEVRADRLVAGIETTLFLQPGDTCRCSRGTIAKVTYRQRGPGSRWTILRRLSSENLQVSE
jgi:hypothetical protein